MNTKPRNEKLGPPAMEANGTKAWRQDMETIRKLCRAECERRGMPPQGDATLAMWLIEAPWANIAWHSYFLLVIHLRPVENLPPPRMYLKGATHEVILFAMDPDYAPESLGDNFAVHILNPANFAAQFAAAGDGEAVAKVEECVREIVAGVLSPDTDYTQQWIRRFNASMIKGDPSRVGETVIVQKKPDGSLTRIVYDPKPGDQPANYGRPS